MIARRRKSTFAAAVVTILIVVAKRSYKNAKLGWLIKRLIGCLLCRLLKIPMPRVISGAGSASQIGSILRELGCSKPLIVTDQILVSHGHVKRCTDSLAAAAIQHETFDTVVPNPPSELVEEGYDRYKKAGCDSIIAFGGGSPMDCAKAIGAMVANPKSDIQEYAGFFNVNMFGWRPLPPLIAVPTTAGTGSETTIAAVISIVKENKKIFMADLGLVPRVAVLDPELLLKLPKNITAATGIDALTHAVESYLSAMATTFTRGKSYAASEKIFKYITTSYHDGANIEAREAMLIASFEAGVAFTRANVGYVHAIAHQLGGMFHTPHGDANAMLLPYVLDFYLQDEGAGGSSNWCTERYCELAKAAGLAPPTEDIRSLDAGAKMALAWQFVSRLEDMNMELCIPTHVPSMKAKEVTEVASRALRESHGELHKFVLRPKLHLFDLGYPTPKYMTLSDCEGIVANLLSAGERLKWDEQQKSLGIARCLSTPRILRPMSSYVPNMRHSNY